MKTSPYLLVIDDENHICESCDRIFTQAGYRVDTNINASSGFRQALSNPYDAIILDLNLIETDGLKLLYGIRKRKPEVPVVIITGYPSEESRRVSTTLGVSDYILKPFAPAEILEPVGKITAGAAKTTVTEAAESHTEQVPGRNYHFLHTSWFYQLENGIVRVGGYLPNLAGSFIKSFDLPEPGFEISRGLPIARAVFNDGTEQVIPSPVTGKVKMVNSQLKDHFYNLEKNIHKKSWIATVEPSHPDVDLRLSEIRKILVFSMNGSSENEFFRKFVNNGYSTVICSDINQVINILSNDVHVLVLDAREFGESGPSHVRKINQKCPGARIIVCNEARVELEKQYRKNQVFYYGINPISNNEMVDILHCAFTSGTGRISLKNPNISSFLPNTIDRITITNKYGSKVALYSYNEILQHSDGLGYLLTKDLLGMYLPVDIHHSRLWKIADVRAQGPETNTVFERYDRVIILQTREFGAIPGSITRRVQEYTNERSSQNRLVHISIQPQSLKSGKTDFDTHTTMALRDIILNEMMSR